MLLLWNSYALELGIGNVKQLIKSKMDTPYRGYADLNPQKRIKCAQFLPYFDEQRSVELTEMLDKAGENSFKPVLAKVHILSIEKPEVQVLNDKLYEAFPLNQQVNEAGVISTVSKVRRELGLQPYTQALTATCMSEFRKLFIVRVTHSQQLTANSTPSNPKYRKAKDGYTPVFKLKP